MLGMRESHISLPSRSCLSKLLLERKDGNLPSVESTAGLPEARIAQLPEKTKKIGGDDEQMIKSDGLVPPDGQQEGVRARRLHLQRRSAGSH